MKIKQEDTKIVISLDFKHPVSGWFAAFTYECNNAFNAKLQAHNLEQALGDLVEKTRREEYEKGYKDGRTHKNKETWFSRLLK